MTTPKFCSHIKKGLKPRPHNTYMLFTSHLMRNGKTMLYYPMKKKITIHKKNEIIRGTDDYSVMGKRALNAIYWAYQKHDLFKHNSVPISFATLRRLMHLEKDNRYVDTLKEAMRELKATIELNNFYHPIDECTYSWYATSFINDVGFKKDADGAWVAHVEIGNLMRYIMQLEGNFTPLNIIEYANSFRTKYAMKIYEYLKSFGGYRYLDITQKHMMSLLSLDEKSTYKYYSKLTELVERQLKEIALKSDLKEVRLMHSKALTKDRIFRIMIDPKNKKNVEKIIAKTALDNLIKRF